MNNEKAISVLKNLKKAIKGKDNVLEMVVIALLAQGHLLIEDVPGVGKTTLVKALAKSINLEYRRIQFTPDLMPSDIIGVNVFHRDTSSFIFRKGPLFTQILLADEINRTSPKTQSSLLQAMEEGEVSTEDEDYRLEKPFMVLATQNPLEYQGTFPLPEAQLDRFLMRISLGYPSREDEIKILQNHQKIRSLVEVEPVLSAVDLIAMQEEVVSMKIHRDILSYIVGISEVTRSYEDLRLGASPRASIDLLKASKACAFIKGRDYVIPDDVKEMAIPVLGHRLILSPEAKIDRKNMDSILKGVLKRVTVPVSSYE
ncbi:MAG: AAA family ATPase [Bacillota bacterium]